MKDAEIAEKQREVDSLVLRNDERMSSHATSLESKDERIKVQDAELMDKQRMIDELTNSLEERAMQLASKDGELKVREHELSEARQEVAAAEASKRVCEGLRAATGHPHTREHATLHDLYLMQDVLLSEPFKVQCK